MIFLNFIWKFLNSRIFPYILIGILSLFYLRGCNNIAKERIESDRRLGNYLALKDSVRIITSEKNTLLVEKSAFEKTQAELKRENRDLYNELQFERSKPPKVIIRTVIKYRDTIIVAPSNVFNINDSTGKLIFDYNPELPGANAFRLIGGVPYSLDCSDTLNPVVFGEYKLDITQKIDIKTGLFRDPKSKRTFIRLYTEYPNLSFEDIQAIDITDSDSKEALKANRKEFGLGLNVGYGMAFSKDGYSTGPYIGLGLNYSPKFLQFGK